MLDRARGRVQARTARVGGSTTDARDFARGRMPDLAASCHDRQLPRQAGEIPRVRCLHRILDPTYRVSVNGTPLTYGAHWSTRGTFEDVQVSPPLVFVGHRVAQADTMPSFNAGTENARHVHPATAPARRHALMRPVVPPAPSRTGRFGADPAATPTRRYHNGRRCPHVAAVSAPANRRPAPRVC